MSLGSTSKGRRASFEPEHGVFLVDFGGRTKASPLSASAASLQNTVADSSSRTWAWATPGVDQTSCRPACIG